jgi:hypothetical protein
VGRCTHHGPGWEMKTSKAWLIGSIIVALVLAFQALTPPAHGALPDQIHAPGLKANTALPLLSTNSVESLPEAASASSVPPEPSGVWQTDDGLVFNLSVASGGSTTSTVLNDSCTGGPRSTFITGTLNNTTLTGTMYQCSPANDSLDLNCSLPAIWSTPFNATVGNYEINGTYQGEYWVWNVTASGQWTDCHIDHYTNDTFSANRMDCGLRSFAELAEQYITDPSQTATEINLANQFENGVTLVWTAAQSAPGGFQAHVTAYQNALLEWGISSTVTSAYRPILYQAHFADMRICLLQMLQTVIATPADAKYLGPSVALVNQAVQAHGLKTQVYNVGGLTFDVPYVCWQAPLTQCAHVNQRAVDMRMSNPSQADSIGALYGFCRPYPGPDPVHWEYIGASPWGNPKCPAAGTGPGNAEITITGNSPINLLVTSPSGEQIGFDPSTDTVVNDFGPGEAIYSGPGTHPQVIDISSNATEPGNYSVTGVGTGNGPYTIGFSAIDEQDSDVATIVSRNQTGTANLGTAISPVSYSVPSNYSLPSPWSLGTPGPIASGITPFTVDTPGGLVTFYATSSSVEGLMFNTSEALIALEPKAEGGQTTLTIPHLAVAGPFTVRADGTIVPSNTTNSTSGYSVTFDMPANDTAITIDGTPPSTITTGSSPFPWWTVALTALVLVVVAAVGAAVLLRRSHKSPPPPPPPPPSASPPWPPPPPPAGLR